MEAIEIPEHDAPYRQWSFPLPRQSCQAHLPTSEPAVKLQCNSASRQESSGKATKICTRSADKFPSLSIQVKSHVCSGCRRTFFDGNHLYGTAKTGRIENALLCGYITNSCSTMTKLKPITLLSISAMGSTDQRGVEPLSLPPVEYSDRKSACVRVCDSANVIVENQITIMHGTCFSNLGGAPRNGEVETWNTDAG